MSEDMEYYNPCEGCQGNTALAMCESCSHYGYLDSIEYSTGSSTCDGCSSGDCGECPYNERF